jgi:hypothetical protein
MEKFILFRTDAINALPAGDTGPLENHVRRDDIVNLENLRIINKANTDKELEFLESRFKKK